MKKVAVKEAEMLHTLWLKEPKFRQQIETLRKVHQIPTEGFSSPILAFEWVSKDPRKYLAVTKDILELIKLYNLPKGTEVLLTEYVITNAEIKIVNAKYENTPAYVVPEKEKGYRYVTEEKRLQESGIPYVKILVYPHATSKTLVSFIKKHYGTQIKPQIEAHTGLRKRIRTTPHKKRDRDVVRTWKEDLGKEKQGMKQTKENRVATKLKTTPETVRKTLQKTRKGSPIR